MSFVIWSLSDVIVVMESTFSLVNRKLSSVSSWLAAVRLLTSNARLCKREELVETLSEDIEFCKDSVEEK
jgi:hypothetical protein